MRTVLSRQRGVNVRVNEKLKELISVLTLCLSMCKKRRFGSNSNLSGSKLTGDCLRPLLHSDHSGLMRPQNAGPITKLYK